MSGCAAIRKVAAVAKTKLGASTLHQQRSSLLGAFGFVLADYAVNIIRP
jgi:hypothetical protein